MVAYRLLAGSSGVPSDAPDATAPVATAAARMPPLAEARPGLPRGLIEAVQQALAHEPYARQDSVAEFRAQLVDGQSLPLRRPHDNALFPEAVRGALRSAA
jgi:hypothetical protein